MDEHEKLIASYIFKFADVSTKIKILLKIKWRIDTELLNWKNLKLNIFQWVLVDEL